MTHWAYSDKREATAAKISVRNKGKVPWNKKEPVLLVCEGCGNNYLEKRDKTRYCTQQCYLKHNNPRKNPTIIAAIANQIKGDNNPAKRLESRLKISRRLKGRLAPWASETSKRPDVRAKLSEIAKQRWGNSTWHQSMLISCRDGGLFNISVESHKHRKLKTIVCLYLQAMGYNTQLEVPIKTLEKWYIVDVVGINNKHDKVAVECGDCKKIKLLALRERFDYVYHIPYGEKINIEEVIKCR